MYSTAAERFMAGIRESWDSPAPWEDTARLGLSDVDQDILQAFCAESGESYEVAEDVVLTSIRCHVAEPEIRYSADATISMVWSDGEPVRCPTQHDMDTLPVGEDMTDDEVAALDD